MTTGSLLNFTVPLGNTGNSPSSQGLLMPKLGYRFRVTFLNFGIDNATTELTKQVMTCGRPKLDLKEGVIDVYNSKVYYAGKYSWDAISISLRDDAQGQVSGLIGQQIQKQFDFFNQASASSAIDYKFQTNLEVLDGGNGAVDPVVLETWQMYGCWIKDAEYGEQDYAKDDPLTIKLSVRFDNALQIPLGTGVGSTVTRTNGSIAV